MEQLLSVVSCLIVLIVIVVLCIEFFIFFDQKGMLDILFIFLLIVRQFNGKLGIEVGNCSEFKCGNYVKFCLRKFWGYFLNCLRFEYLIYVQEQNLIGEII